MTRPLPARALALPMLLFLGACASLPTDRGRSDVDALLATSGHAWPSTPPTDPNLDARLSQPLTADDAVEIAWLYSPRIRMPLAELGLAAADLFESGRLRNPALSGSRIGGHDGTTTIGLSAIVSDLITLSARHRIGRARWRAAVADAAHVLIEEAAATRADYYDHVGALQIAAMREAVVEAAETSAELARRFHAAGNISALQLAREEAAATLARTDAATARAARIETRMALAERLGLAGQTNRWRVADRLPMPPEDDPDVESLLRLAHERRLDIAAARAALEAGDDTVTLTRRFRWLGDVEFGVEREREGGERESGPTLSLELPLFQQGQAGMARAQATRDSARERLTTYELAIERDVRSGIARLAAQREIVAAYRDALIPQREAIVARELERYNFMLIGAFELIQARQEEYNAYQQYLEAIRDYWRLRTGLSAAVGGPLPGDDDPLPRAPGTDDILKPSPMSHGHHHGDTP